MQQPRSSVPDPAAYAACVVAPVTLPNGGLQPYVNPEIEAQMDRRLSDDKIAWQEREA